MMNPEADFESSGEDHAVDDTHAGIDGLSHHRGVMAVRMRRSGSSPNNNHEIGEPRSIRDTTRTRHDATTIRNDPASLPPAPSTPVLRKRTMSFGGASPGNHFRSPRDTRSSSSSRSNPNLSNSNDGAIESASTQNDYQNNGIQQQQQQQQQSQTIIEIQEQRTPAPTTTGSTQPPSAHDRLILQQFWRTYDTIMILSIFAVFGIVFRMMSATWFRMELGSVFSEDSALGTNLPLNMWSCFLMGLLCSGRDAMGIVHSKVLGGANLYGSGRGILDVGRGAVRGVVDAGRTGISRVRGYGNVHGNTPNRERRDINLSSSPAVSMSVDSSGNLESSISTPGLHTRRGNVPNVAISPTAQSIGSVGQSPLVQNALRSNSRSEDSIAGLLGLDDEFQIVGSHKSSEDEIREVQLRGLTRRIMASPSLAFFPAKKQDMDVMEHYESDQLQPHRNESNDHFEIGDLDDDNINDDVESGEIEMSEQLTSPSGEASGEGSGREEPRRSPSQQAPSPSENDNNQTYDRQRSGSSSAIEELVDEMTNTINDHVTTFRRIHILDGWNVGTSPDNMKHIILLGLRVGFCGALSTFSSLNASVIRLLRAGSVGEALVGYAISIQLGIVSYRFGQHFAVYIFVWRCRRETKRDERRGYGLRLQRLDTEEEQLENTNSSETMSSPRRQRYIPSVRTIATILFIAMFVTLCLAIKFVPSHQQYLLSLLFTPFGCLARWKLMSKYNKNLPGFPLGTFACNIGGCALSGSLGSFLAGNPGPEESIVLQSMIAGFAGSLSTFAAFIVEILSLIDPIIFKFDGVVYSVITILWAVVIGQLGSQAKNWADEI